MLYLDYSATTPVDEEVLASYGDVCRNFIGNPNSLHRLGVASMQLIEEATHQIASLLQVKPSEIIYTSGATESNNLAIKGIAFQYQNRGKHIITTMLEHSSVIAPCGFLQQLGFTVDFVSLKEDGTIDLAHLQELITEDTILVSIHSVSSELGVLQPLEEIKQILAHYPKCFFHVDMTQSMGKIPLSLDGIDLVSCSAHKFYGLKGIGLLIKKERVQLQPLFHGGKSTTLYRSGTPATPLIASISKALRLAYDRMAEQPKVSQISTLLKKNLLSYPQVRINSTEQSIPHIVNFSVLGVKPETLQHALEEYDIYISTQSACSSGHAPSKAVEAVTHDIERATSSVRVSLSYLTTEQDIVTFMKAFDVCYHRLVKEC